MQLIQRPPLVLLSFLQVPELSVTIPLMQVFLYFWQVLLVQIEPVLLKQIQPVLLEQIQLVLLEQIQLFSAQFRALVVFLMDFQSQSFSELDLISFLLVATFLATKSFSFPLRLTVQALEAPALALVETFWASFPLLLTFQAPQSPALAHVVTFWAM